MSSIIWEHIIILAVVGGLANMAPVFVKSIPFLTAPIDGGKSWRGKRLLGNNKTWRGAISSCVVGIGGMFLIAGISWAVWSSSIPILVSITVGFLIGLGTVIGDLFFSFVKRQLSIAPGRPFIPFDQIDWVIGSWLLYSIVIDTSLMTLLILMFIIVPIHIATNVIGYFFGLKDTYW